MGKRVLGSRRRPLLLLPVIALTALAMFFITNALAVHDLGLFQLDRNAVDGGAGDDWNTPPKPNGGAAVFTGIIGDTAAPGTQFQGGGSKDNNDLDQWLWKDGEPLDKDDITNAYAAGYVNTLDTGDTDVGDFIVYYGLDRFSNAGSAQVGFWFLKNGIDKTNVASGGGFKFSGVHAVGDILVQSNFSQGGVISSISVFEWVGSGGSNGALDLLTDGADCVDTNPVAPGNQALAGDDPACATVNQATTDAPWAYTPKEPDPANPTDFPAGTFFEGGINLTRLVPNIGCISTFLAETRSSTPFDSRLKDWTRGNFNTCVVSVGTTSSTTSSTVVPGTSVSDTATVTGSSLAGGTAPTPTGTVKFFLCQPSQVTSAGCPTGSGTQVGGVKTLNASGQATSDGTTGTTTNAIGKYCWRAEYTPASDSPYSAASHTNATTECFTTVAQPTTTTTRQFVYPQDKAKIAASSGGNLAGSVTFKLFDSAAECANGTDVKYTETLSVSGAAPQTKKTSNGSYAIVDGTTHYWKVTYTSTNPAQLGSESACTETTAVTFAGNDSSITVP